MTWIKCVIHCCCIEKYTKWNVVKQEKCASFIFTIGIYEFEEMSCHDDKIKQNQMLPYGIYFINNRYNNIIQILLKTVFVFCFIEIWTIYRCMRLDQYDRDALVCLVVLVTSTRIPESESRLNSCLKMSSSGSVWSDRNQLLLMRRNVEGLHQTEK